MFICWQKINFILRVFMEMLEDIAMLLFQVLWACLATHTQSDTINLGQIFLFICRQKSNFIVHVFLEILKRCCKLVILGTLGMLGYAHPKWYYQLGANVSVYLQGKKEFNRPCFSGDIEKIFQACYFRYSGHAWLRTPKVILSACRKSWCLSACRK